MDQTPPRAFQDDDDVGFGKTPEPRRRRIEELERRGELLCREKGSLVRKLDAETKRFDSSLKAKMTECEEMRAVLAKTQRELERSKAEAEGMKEEMGMFGLVSQQKALLVLAQEQLRVVDLEHRLVLSEQQQVIREHQMAVSRSREAELLAEVEERDGRIAELESFHQASSSDKDQLALSARSAAADLAKAQKENAALVAQIEKLEGSAASLKTKEKEMAAAAKEKTKLATQVAALEASVESWKGKEQDVRGQLEGLMSGEKDKDDDSDKEVRNLKAQLRSAKADLESKEGEVVDLQEELASLKERSTEREKELKAKLKTATEQSEEVVSLQAQVNVLKASAKKAVAEVERAKAARGSGAGEQDGGVLPQKKASSPKPTARAGKERTRKAPSVEADSDTEVMPKKTKRVHESPAKAKVINKLSKLSREIADESDAPDSPSPVKIRKASSSFVRASTSKPLGESIIPNKISKSATMSALASKRKSSGPEKAPTITVTPADEDGPAIPREDMGDKSQVHGEKKKKRKLLGTKAAFKWDPILESGSGVIPSTFSPMKPGVTGTIPRLGLTHSASARALSRI